MSISPREQHNAQAKKILARRGNAETVDETKTVDETETVVAPKVPTKKELRAECDGRGIEYKKKDTVAQLLALLEE